MNKVKTIAEIGINHNGCIDTAKKLIDIAKFAGFDYVKFQKRNPEVCVPENQKYKLKNTPWGEMVYLDYKFKIEFRKKEYDEINRYCKKLNINWFASVWDNDSVDFMKQYTDFAKVPSALIHNIDLVKYSRNNFNNLMISTGMSTEEEIETVVNNTNPNIIFHTNSAYPSPIEDLNLQYITWLKEKYPNSSIGYSGHEFGLSTTFAAIVLGANWIERHITLDRTMWGSDQMASIEPTGMIKLIKGIKDIELAISKGYSKRMVLPSELSKRESLRG